MVALDGKKGALAAGYDADFLIFDPDAPFTVHGADLHPSTNSPLTKTSSSMEKSSPPTYVANPSTRTKNSPPASGQILLRPQGGCGSESGVE